MAGARAVGDGEMPFRYPERKEADRRKKKRRKKPKRPKRANWGCRLKFIHLSDYF